MRNPKKRREIFYWLKSTLQTADVIFLQETHCHLNKEVKQWSTEWSRKNKSSFWSKGTSRSKGVGILFSDHMLDRGFQISDVDIDPNGRFINLMMELNENKYRLLNIYAPNNGLERARFFLNLHDLMCDDQEAENICGGDFNCTLDSIMDRLNCNNNTDIGQIDIKHIMDTFQLEDIWRRRYPHNREFTWEGQGRKSRIDLWLTSASLNSQIESIEHRFAPFTDHNAVKMKLNLNEVQRGRGIWKMNSSHLLHEEYKQEITTLWQNWQQSRQEYENLTTWWDLGKKKIKQFSINYSKEYNMNNKCRLEELEKEINHEMKNNPDSETVNTKKLEYNTLLTDKTQGARIRSRIEHWEEGEKSTKYFYNLEKRNGKDKAWDKILGKRGELITGQRGIQKRQVEFYSELFATERNQTNEHEHSKQFFLSETSKRLSESSKIKLEEYISKDEIAKAIKLMQNNKSPGPDGITVEFYKLYWHLIGDDLHNVYLKGLEDKKLAYSQYLAAIILLYKKGDRADIRNWRPISLLNVDYKIISKVMAERLKTVLHEIIHTDQKGCISGRYIGENVRLVDDLISMIDKQDEDATFILLDQEKAFDRVEWDWLHATLKYYNFGDKFIEWINTFYKHAKSCIVTNGYQSEFFDISRGIRQGDSLSALLYIIQFEPLAHKLRTSENIEGVKVQLTNINENIEVKGSQYVDDNITMVSNINSIPHFTGIIKKYESASGSKVNKGKTVAMTIQQNVIYEKIQGIKLTNGPELALGVPVGKSKDDYKAFWEELIEKVRLKLNIWRQRDLSFEGKTLLVRSMAISKILYAVDMKHFKKEHVKTVTDIIFNFLWSGKNYKIKRNVCYLPRNQGGLGLADLETVIKAKRIKWIIRALSNQDGQNWAKLIENYIRCLDNKFGVDFFTLKVTDSSDLVGASEIPPFYKECITNFQELLDKGGEPHKHDIIWCNKAHTFQGKPLTFSHWSRSGIVTINDLYTNNTLNSAQIANKVHPKSGFIFEFSKIKKAFSQTQQRTPNVNIVRWGRQEILDQPFNVPGITEKKSLKELTAKEIYNILLLSKPVEIRSKEYWLQKLGLEDIKWDTWFEVNNINKLTPRKTKDFNWRLLHGLVNTEKKLKAMKLSDGLCKMCNRGVVEDINHLLYDCQNAKELWGIMEQIVTTWLNEPFIIQEIQALTGVWNNEYMNVDNKILIINTLLSICRHHIWRRRCSIKYGNEQINQTQNKKLLKWRIIEHLDLLIQSNTMSSSAMSGELKEIIFQIF